MLKRLSYLALAGLFLLIIGISNTLAHNPATHSGTTITDNNDPADDNKRVPELISDLKKDGFDITNLLEDSRFELYDGIADRFRKSAERKSQSLEYYKEILGFEIKSQRIRDFITEHNDQLQKASDKYGISKYVIAAILGIESD